MARYYDPQVVQDDRDVYVHYLLRPEMQPASKYIPYTVCTVDKLNSLYCDLLRRLDDSSDEVRLTLTKTLEAYIQ